MRRGVMGMVMVVAALAASASAMGNPITDENAQSGTSGWQYPYANRGTQADQYAGTVLTIEGFPSRESVLPGGKVDLHVSAAGGRPYRVEVFRLGWYASKGARRMLCLPSCAGSKPGVQQANPPAPDANGEVATNWTVTDTIQVGANWTSGYYIAQLVLADGPDAGNSRYVPFVVRPPASNRAKVLVQVPTNNWQAYNGWGGKSLYDNKSLNGRANRVSLDRPYWGAMYDMFDHEMQGVRFLEREGYDVVYATDMDVHQEPSLLMRRSAVVVNGHDEYWTKQQRDAFEAARAAGVNLAFLGANLGYWQVRYSDDFRTMIGYKSQADPITPQVEKTDLFRAIGRPECQLMGVQYDNSWATDGVQRDYAVDAASLAHRWFSGTGFVAGDAVADTVGYEWDFITPGCSTPPLTRLFSWSGLVTRSDVTNLPTQADAVTYTHSSGAKVFSAGSLHFTRGLDGYRGYGYGLGPANPKLQAIMRNILDEFVSSAPPSGMNLSPTAAFKVSPATPAPGQAITLTDTSADSDGTIVKWAWDLDGNGVYNDVTTRNATVTFPTTGPRTVGLMVTDDDGATATAVTSIQVVAPATPAPSTQGRPEQGAPVLRTQLPPLPGDVTLPPATLRGLVRPTRMVSSVCKRAPRAKVRRARLGIEGCFRPVRRHH